jgi:hypothetical protein
LRFNFVVAKGRGGSPSRPPSGNPAGCPYHQFLRAWHVGASGRSPIMGVRPDAPTIETIVLSTFCEINKIKHQGIEEKAKNNRKAQTVS